MPALGKCSTWQLVNGYDGTHQVLLQKGAPAECGHLSIFVEKRKTIVPGVAQAVGW